MKRGGFGNKYTSKFRKEKIANEIRSLLNSNKRVDFKKENFRQVNPPQIPEYYSESEYKESESYYVSYSTSSYDWYDEYEKEIIDFCAARNVTFFTISSDDPIEKVIFGKGYEAEVIK